MFTTYPELERYSLTCWACCSETFFDYDKDVPQTTTCWRCGEILNGDL